MNHFRARLKQRQRRKYRVRKRFGGTAERPRLSVFRSNKHIYVQLIDDQEGKTLVAASTREKSVQKSVKYGGNKDAATVIGKTIGKRAEKAGIKQICFDRGPFKYHGRVAALAEAAREAGLSF